MTIEEAIKKSGTKMFFFGSTIKEAQSRLREDESLLYAMMTRADLSSYHGVIDSDYLIKMNGYKGEIGVFAITTKRVFLLCGTLGVTTFKEIFIDKIQTIQDATAPVIPDAGINIKATTESIIVLVPKKKLSEIKRVLADVRCDAMTQNVNIVSGSKTSIADEIMKFKELLDCGAITQEEFDKKKKELLGF